MKVSDKVKIIADNWALERVGVDYLKEKTGIITGFYNTGYIELEVMTIFSDEPQKIDVPKYFVELINNQ